MTDAPPASAQPPHGRQNYDGARNFKIRMRLRKSQLEALIACARRMDTPFATFVRMTAMRRAHREKPATDPSVDVSINVTESERKVIEGAASRTHVDVSQYVRDSSVSAVAELIAGKTIQPPSRDDLRTFRKSHEHEGRSGPGAAPSQDRRVG